MDPLTLAQSAVGILIPYLVKAGKAVVEEAGPVWEKVKAVHAAVKSALGGDGLGAQTLERVEENPEDTTWREPLAATLAEALEKNATLAEELQSLVADAEASGADVININVTVTGHGRVGTMTNIGKAGDVTIGAPKTEPDDHD